MSGELRQEPLAGGVGGQDVGGRQRDLRAEDPGGRGRDRTPAPLHHVPRQAEHGGGLPASADHRHDVVTRQAERLRQFHRLRVPRRIRESHRVAR